MPKNKIKSLLIENALDLIRNNEVAIIPGLHRIETQTHVHYSSEGGESTIVKRVKTRILPFDKLMELFKAIAKNTSLIELNLCGNISSGLSSNVREAFLKCLQQNKTLKTLDLSENGVLSIELEQLLKTKTTLTQIRLTKIATQTPVHVNLTPGCLKDSTLEVLDVSKNGLGDVGIRNLISAFAGNKTLKKLIISGNGISKAFLQEIPSLIMQVPMLTQIDLGLLTHRKGKVGRDIKKITELHAQKLEFFEACNFLLMYWWRESSSPYSESPLSILSSTVVICILSQLRDLYKKTTSDEVLCGRTLLFVEEQNETLYKNLFPKDIIKKTQFKNLASLKEAKVTGVCNYAITANGQLLFGKKFKDPGGSHIDLVNGCKVRAAGEIEFKNGKIVNYDNASGHYLPEPEPTKDAMKLVLKELGEKPGKFIAKEWQVDETNEYGGDWVPIGKKHK